MPEDLELYSYFMVRVRHSAAAPAPAAPACAGLVERLDTGEKRAFGSAEELLRLLAAWRPGRISIPAEPPREQRAVPGGAAPRT